MAADDLDVARPWVSDENCNKLVKRSQIKDVERASIRLTLLGDRSGLQTPAMPNDSSVCRNVKWLLLAFVVGQISADLSSGKLTIYLSQC